MHPTRPRLWLIAVLVGGAACILVAGWILRPQVYDSIRRADRITVHEGLPHQSYENEIYQKELGTKPTVELADHPFYREPLTLKADDLETLRDLIGAGDTYTAPLGASGDIIVEKTCGGFHPDFAVEWSIGGKVTLCLICFGCSEVQFVDPQGKWFYYDLRFEGSDPESGMKLRDLLKQYRTNRPPHERFGIGPLAVMNSR